MNWDRLPPRHIKDCRHRLVVISATGEKTAVCQLLAEAGLPREHSEVADDICSACLHQFPAQPSCWNTVIASLLYLRSRRALSSAARSAAERTHLAQLRDRAADHLVFATCAGPQPGPQAAGPAPLSSGLAALPSRKRQRARVRSWAVGVVSSPRRQPTLETTLDSLIRAGWDTPQLFLDGTVRVAARFAELPGVLREPRVGCWPNYYLALAELLLRQPEADAYLLVQDDALFYNGEVLRDYLEQRLWPERRPCLVSLYCPSLNTAPTPGWHPLEPGWSVGSLAFIFPRRLAQAFLLDQTVGEHRWNRWQEADRGLANTDIVIGQWAGRKRIRIWCPTPSLVQHIGVTSTLGLERDATGERRAARWLGSWGGADVPAGLSAGDSRSPEARDG